MTDPRQHDLPEGLVDVSRCLAEAGKLRSRSWDDPALRGFGLRSPAVKIAAVGLAVLVTLAVAQLPRPGGLDVSHGKTVTRSQNEAVAELPGQIAHSRSGHAEALLRSRAWWESFGQRRHGVGIVAATD